MAKLECGHNSLVFDHKFWVNFTEKSSLCVLNSSDCFLLAHPPYLSEHIPSSTGPDVTSYLDCCIKIIEKHLVQRPARSTASFPGCLGPSPVEFWKPQAFWVPHHANIFLYTQFEILLLHHFHFSFICASLRRVGENCYKVHSAPSHISLASLGKVSPPSLSSELRCS